MEGGKERRGGGIGEVEWGGDVEGGREMRGGGGRRKRRGGGGRGKEGGRGERYLVLNTIDSSQVGMYIHFPCTVISHTHLA